MKKREAVTIVLLFLVFMVSCGRLFMRRVTVQESMIWACAPDQLMAAYPEAQPVRLKFVEKPNYELVVFGKELCDRLTSSGKRIVPVDFEAWGNSRSGLRGFTVVSIDGETIINAGGRGTASVTGAPGSHPLSQHFK